MSFPLPQPSQPPAHRQEVCAMCGKAAGSSPIVEKLDGEDYAFDSESCALLFKRFRSVYGKGFFS